MENIEQAKGQEENSEKPRYKFKPSPKPGYTQSSLDEKIDSAKKSDGHLITITTIEDSETKPTYFISKHNASLIDRKSVV